MHSKENSKPKLKGCPSKGRLHSTEQLIRTAARLQKRVIIEQQCGLVALYFYVYFFFIFLFRRSPLCSTDCIVKAWRGVQTNPMKCYGRMRNRNEGVYLTLCDRFMRKTEKRIFRFFHCTRCSKSLVLNVSIHLLKRSKHS